MNRVARLKAKMHMLEYLNALSAARHLAREMAELDWISEQQKTLDELYEEAQSIFANAFIVNDGRDQSDS